MDDFLTGIFRSELRGQCEFVELGASQLQAALGEGGTRKVWFALQSILMSAGNISKLLWGSKEPEVLESRRSLREGLGVSDESPLNSRRLRNDFEHFDERLEERFGGPNARRIYVGRNIGPPGMIVIGDEVPSGQFGHFDPSTGVVTFWDRSISIPDLLAEVRRIRPLLDDA